MFWSQDDIIFPTGMVASPGALPAGAEKFTIKAADGETLHGVHISPAGKAKGQRTLILGFGGNAWNGQDVATFLHELYPHADVVTFHYRGYRPSTGKPSAEALLADAPLVYDAAVARVKAHRTVAVGFSIGSGIAASLANRKPLDGIILVTPFDSLKAVASGMYPWLPIGLLFQHEVDTVNWLKGSKVPVAIIAAAQDEIIPTSRTEALRPEVPNLVFDRTIKGAGHNDIYTRGTFQDAMDEALDAVG